MAKIFLVDTMFHIYRAFYALPTMAAPDGTPTQAVRGLVGILSNLWKSEKIRHLACIFEPLDAGIRATIDPNYKAHRPPVPEELAIQVPLAEAACQALGIPTFRHDPYEADDVMATLAVQVVRAGHEAVIVSNDKDLAQLCVHPGVSLLRVKGSGKNMALEYIDHNHVEQLFGVPAALIPSWLALNGDSVDNIPGIAGIGPKTACKLLNQLGPLPGLLNRAGEAGRFSQALLDHRERLERNLQLATLYSELPVEFSLPGLTPGEFQGLAELYRRLGMKRNLEALEGGLFSPRSVLELWS